MQPHAAPMQDLAFSKMYTLGCYRMAALANPDLGLELAKKLPVRKRCGAGGAVLWAGFCWLAVFPWDGCPACLHSPGLRGRCENPNTHALSGVGHAMHCPAPQYPATVAPPLTAP